MSNSEDTNIVVRKMLKQRRSMRLPIIGGVLVAIAFTLFMVINFGNKQRESGLNVDGPVYSGKTMGNRGPDDVPPPAAPVRNAADDGPPASVEVLVPGKEAKDVTLWVDGRQVGTGPKHSLSLPPGKHVLMFQTKERTVMQKLTLGSSDAYRVEMRDKVTFTKLH